MGGTETGRAGRPVALFDAARGGRWTGGRALAVRDGPCAWCGTRYEAAWVQPALFRGGGYGAADGRTVVWCQCGGLNSELRRSVNPRSL